MDGFAFVLNLQRFTVIAFAFALVARYVNVRQEVHLHFDHAVALTGFAASAANVKAETSWRITTRTGFRYARKQFAHRRKHAGIGRRVRTRSTTNWALVDIDHFIEMLQPLNIAIRCWFGDGRTIQLALGNWEQCVVNQR